MPAMIQGYRPDPRIRQTQLAELRRIYGDVVKQQGAIVFLAGEEGSGRHATLTALAEILRQDRSHPTVLANITPCNHRHLANRRNGCTEYQRATVPRRGRWERIMRPMHLVIIILVAFVITSPPQVHAGGIVSDCDEAHLLAALAGGGMVTFDCSGTITLAATITIAADTTLDGSGQNVIISGNHEVRVFTVNSGVTLNLNQLTIADGHSGTSNGGGVYNLGTLSVTHSTFSGHSARGVVGSYHGYGAGIYNSGTLTVSHSVFSGNSVSGQYGGYGGGIHNDNGMVTVSHGTFYSNSAWYGSGICNYRGMLTVSNSTFSNNSGIYGGGIANWDYGTLIVSHSTFSDNNATSTGGGIENHGGMLTVSNSTFTSNNASSGGGVHNYRYPNSWAIVSDSTFSSNSATHGGGIFNVGNLTVSHSPFSGNSATGGNGGGIYNDYDNADGMLTVSNSSFSDNSANDSITGGNGGNGGGIYNLGALAVSNSSFASNSVTYGSGSGGGHGGGIYNYRMLTVSNSTFSANSAFYEGGGIENYGGTLTVNNSTFSGNSASSGGGIYNRSSATATFKNTIVANSMAGNNCFGVIIDGSGNLNYPDTTCPGIHANPVLGPLQYNGGTTQTMALGPGSAAIDSANNATCATPPVNNRDQRGVIRPQGTDCDIGAYEVLQPCPDFILPTGVGIEDVQATADRWGWTTITPGWDPGYDLNRDNKINIIDIMLVTATWGMMC